MKCLRIERGGGTQPTFFSCVSLLCPPAVWGSSFAGTAFCIINVQFTLFLFHSVCKKQQLHAQKQRGLYIARMQKWRATKRKNARNTAALTRLVPYSVHPDHPGSIKNALVPTVPAKDQHDHLKSSQSPKRAPLQTGSHAVHHIINFMIQITLHRPIFIQPGIYTCQLSPRGGSRLFT